MSSERLARVMIFAVAAAYVLLRLWRLTDSCLWFDEIFSIHAAEHPWNSILSFVALDLIHPPLFYILLKLWIGIGGMSLFWLRSLPVLFAVISLVPFILFLREVKQNKWTQVIALFLMTAGGSLIKYAQEVRMYSLLMCLSLFSMWLFARYFFKGKSFVPLLIVNILLVYTHYFGWFVVCSEVAAILIFQPIKWRRMLTMAAVIFASFVPWMLAVWHAAHSGSNLSQNIGWMTRPGLLSILQLALALVEPFYYQASSVDSVSVFKVSLPILLIFIAAVALYFAHWKRRDKHEQQTVKFLFLFAGIPVIVAFAASWLLPHSIWGMRHLIIIFAPVSILLAIAVAAIPISALRTALLTFVVLWSGYAFVQQLRRPATQYSWCAWEPLANYLKTAQHNSPEPKTLYVFDELVGYHLWFNLRDQNVRVVKIIDAEGVSEDKAYFLPRGFDGVKSVDFAEIDDKMLWLAHRSKAINESVPPIRAFLDKSYKIVDKRVLAADGEDAGIFLLER